MTRDRFLKDRAYQIARNGKYNGYQRKLTSMVYKIFDWKKGLRVSVNEQIIEELHKPVIKKLKGRKVYAILKKIFGGRFSWDGIIIF